MTLTASPHPAQNGLAEDVAYTLNHSLYCIFSDFINPVIGAATDNKLSWMFPGCGQNHVHGAGCSHKPPIDPSLSRLEKVKLEAKYMVSSDKLKHYFQGEFLGDLAAVPLTVGVQYLFPDFMRGLEKLAEPVVRPVIANSAARAARTYAKEHGIAEGSESYEAHKQKVYDYELRHFPQAMVWTASSFGLNTAYQVMVDKTPMPLENKMLIKGASVLSGVLMTAAAVSGARTLMPNRMEAVDGWTHERLDKYVLNPAHHLVHTVFGSKTTDGATPNVRSWQSRVEGEVSADNVAAQPTR
jgi:hypothetical protein